MALTVHTNTDDNHTPSSTCLGWNDITLYRRHTHHSAQHRRCNRLLTCVLSLFSLRSFTKITEQLPQPRPHARRLHHGLLFFNPKPPWLPPTPLDPIETTCQVTHHGYNDHHRGYPEWDNASSSEIFSYVIAVVGPRHLNDFRSLLVASQSVIAEAVDNTSHDDDNHIATQW